MIISVAIELELVIGRITSVTILYSVYHRCHVINSIKLFKMNIFFMFLVVQALMCLSFI